MHFSYAKLSAAMLALTGTASVMASPIEDRSPVNQYHFKTKVVDKLKGSGTNKDGLYLYPYHTGAGLSIGGLSKDKPKEWYVYTGADNQQYFTYNGSAGGWPLQIEVEPYQTWVPTTISISGTRYQGQGFYFGLDGQGLVYNNTNNGWLACDWTYQTPQLFLLQGGYPTVHPSTCSIVQLQPVHDV